MSIFPCSNCGCIENTALCRYWVVGDGAKLCSECDPEIGEWHGRFEREQPDENYALIGNFLYKDPEGIKRALARATVSEASRA